MAYEVAVLTGLQWGDEGKGKIVDALSNGMDATVRYQGGPNAGHTVVVGNVKTVLHHLPTGILHSGVVCVIGNGVVLDPQSLLEEIRMLEQSGIEVGARLRISRAAHVILPWHRELDQLNEAAKGDSFIGTTGRGIGPTYSHKYARTGLRFGQLAETATLRERLQTQLAEVNRLLTRVHQIEPLQEDLIEQVLEQAELLRPFSCDTFTLLHNMMRAGKNILLEGAQGALLDIDHGTYPYVTSSNPTSGGACVGAGLPPGVVGRVIGVLKAYNTRVGEGPFPTEFSDVDFARNFQEQAGEYGATTGRLRRCGWFDGPLARFACRLNGTTELALTKLDVLDDMAEIQFCSSYRQEDTLYDCFPPSELAGDHRPEPVYETLPGWQSSTRAARTFSELPDAARRYVARIEEICETPVKLLSVGPGREELIRR
ncbi:MAG: adenylosuccinate synthase [Candidatus Delongbacteria bacterium]|nr:adenylosuccinate synthase [Candidatus Delongbacteria bacterium]